MKNDRRLAIETFSKKSHYLEKSRELFSNKKDWILTIKSLLGMSSKQLSERLSIDSSAVSKVQNQEKEGAITVKRLEKYANALECDLVYAFVPRKKIDELINDEAKGKAQKILSKSSVMMELEDQEVESTNELQRQLQELIDEIKESKYLWDKA